LGIVSILEEKGVCFLRLLWAEEVDFLSFCYFSFGLLGLTAYNLSHSSAMGFTTWISRFVPWTVPVISFNILEEILKINKWEEFCNINISIYLLLLFLFIILLFILKTNEYDK
jgi:hypothetical protein